MRVDGPGGALDRINALRDDLTQAEVGEKIGWSRGKVNHHTILLDNVATEVLETTREHQEGRVAENATTVATEFTERWFRNSGIYDPENVRPGPLCSRDRLLDNVGTPIWNWPVDTKKDVSRRMGQMSQLLISPKAGSAVRVSSSTRTLVVAGEGESPHHSPR